MIGWRRQKSWLALGVVTTIFLITAIYLAGRLYSERDLLLLNYRNGAWVAVQAQTQLLRLEEAVNRYQVEPTVENKEQVSVRLDLLWSRIPLLLDSAVGQAARTISGMVPKLEDLRRQLPDLERELAALAPGDNEAWKRVVTRLRAFYTPLNELVRRILIYDAFSRNRDNLTSAAIELGLAMALILLCGLFSIFYWFASCAIVNSSGGKKSGLSRKPRTCRSRSTMGLNQLARPSCCLMGRGASCW